MRMNIIEAAEEAKKGKYICRKYNRDFGYILYLSAINTFRLRHNDEPYFFLYNDLIANDWEVIDE